jgi:hypothetical protein
MLFINYKENKMKNIINETTLNIVSNLADRKQLLWAIKNPEKVIKRLIDKTILEIGDLEILEVDGWLCKENRELIKEHKAFLNKLELLNIKELKKSLKRNYSKTCKNACPQYKCYNSPFITEGFIILEEEKKEIACLGRAHPRGKLREDTYSIDEEGYIYTISFEGNRRYRKRTGGWKDKGGVK